MICIDFCVIYRYRVKQLMIFERTVAAASDFKNCTMVNCDYGWCRYAIISTMCPEGEYSNPALIINRYHVAKRGSPIRKYLF